MNVLLFCSYLYVCLSTGFRYAGALFAYHFLLLFFLGDEGLKQASKQTNKQPSLSVPTTFLFFFSFFFLANEDGMI